MLLAHYLSGLGFSPIEIGAIVTATLLGSAALTLAAGLVSNRIGAVRLLFGAAALMFATGLGFAAVTAFWPLLAVAFAGTLNPSGGDVSVFLPVEQSLLSAKVGGKDRTALFARYNLFAALAAALGALASGVPALLARHNDWDVTSAERGGFVMYAAVAILVAAVYLRVQAPPRAATAEAGQRVLAQSRRVVLRLAALFTLDSFGGGFVVQSLLVLWLFQRFDVSPGTAGVVFFAAGLLTAFSQLASSWLASRIGLINTMVFTHLPSNAFLVIAAVMPSAPLAVTFLLLRMSLSQMDVPARQSFVMAVVPPEERAAAASVTNVPRSLGAALSPLLAGALLSSSSAGWPLILGGGCKIVYDLMLLAQFRKASVSFDD